MNWWHFKHEDRKIAVLSKTWWGSYFEASDPLDIQARKG